MKITLAIKITIARIFLIIPTIAMFIAAELARVSQGAHIALVVIAAALFAICCATDFVDGHIARKTNTVSMLGKFLDPLADKVVIVVMLFLVVYFGDGLSMGGVYPHNTLVIALLSGLILSRELMIGVFRSIAASRGLVLAADIFGKIKTVFLDVGVTLLMLAGLHPVLGWLGTITFYIGSFFAVYSGLNYVLKNKHVLRQSDDETDGNSDNQSSGSIDVETNVDSTDANKSKADASDTEAKAQ